MLSGQKTYIAAAAGIVIGIADMTIFPMAEVNGGQLVMESIMFIFARLGIAKVEAAS